MKRFEVKIYVNDATYSPAMSDGNPSITSFSELCEFIFSRPWVRLGAKAFQTRHITCIELVREVQE